MSHKTYKRGTVVSTKGSLLTVAIDRYSACSSCHAATTCPTSERKQVMVEARLYHDAHVEVGDQVYVSMGGKSPVKPIMIGYGFPLAILAVACIATASTTQSDITAAVTGLGATAAYYIILWTLKPYLNRLFTCTATPCQDSKTTR